MREEIARFVPRMFFFHAACNIFRISDYLAFHFEHTSNPRYASSHTIPRKIKLQSCRSLTVALISFLLIFQDGSRLPCTPLYWYNTKYVLKELKFCLNRSCEEWIERKMCVVVLGWSTGLSQIITSNDATNCGYDPENKTMLPRQQEARKMSNKHAHF